MRFPTILFWILVSSLAACGDDDQEVGSRIAELETAMATTIGSEVGRDLVVDCPSLREWDEGVVFECVASKATGDFFTDVTVTLGGGVDDSKFSFATDEPAR